MSATDEFARTAREAEARYAETRHATEAESAPVEEAMNRLGKAAEVAFALEERLTHRLGSVLAPEPPTETVSAVRDGTGVELADRIDAVAEALERHGRRLSATTDRLGL